MTPADLNDVPASGVEKAAIIGTGRALLRDISLPAAVVYQRPLAHNIAWMQTFAERHGARLAPHGKTTMTPALFRRQLEAGAWGITLATATQCVAAFEHGVTRLLMANQLVGAANMALVAGMIARGAEFHCVVDGVANVRALDEFFAARGLRLQVMIELGVEGGRCGVRNDGELETLLMALEQSSALVLSGIEGYEGIIGGQTPIADVRAYGARLVDTLMRLKRSAAFTSDKPVVTASGSKWFDLIAEAFDRADLRGQYIPLLRPGCYVVHDHKLYAGAMDEVKERHADLQGELLPALEVFAHVQSLPEPGLAIVALGKRDIGCDPDLPMPQRLYREGQAPQDVRGWGVRTIMDQHLFLSVPAGETLAVGDIISFGTSHPCLTFDKWRQVLLVDEALDVVEVMSTRF
ncbi:amino acid deaminase [Pseudomonas sp. WHRI 8822A]|uniref:amino acid deaminase n=1 Tax=Pseudomonas sp. WHRI 8822A TaxID=3162568 RepID=UPI0032EB747A